jgi:NTE family protein
MLVMEFERGSVKGVLIKMGNSIRDTDIKFGRQRDQKSYDRFQSDQDVAMSFQHPTDLKAMSERLFDRVARHGYEIADSTLTALAPALFSRSFEWRSAQ